MLAETGVTSDTLGAARITLGVTSKFSSLNYSQRNKIYASRLSKTNKNKSKQGETGFYLYPPGFY